MHGRHLSERLSRTRFMSMVDSWSRNPSMRHSVHRTILLLAAIHLGLAGPLSGQSLAAATPPLAQVSGRVLVITLAPLTGAEVTIQPVYPAATPPLSRSMLTGIDGVYRFRSLKPGEYRLTVSQLGYLTTTIEVDVREAPSLDVSIALEM